MRLAGLAFAILVVAPIAVSAHVVELTTGQKVEGTLKNADANSVRVEIGGQVVTFKGDQVRAIWYGVPLSSTGHAAGPGAKSVAAL